MESHEVLRKAIYRRGVKVVAGELRVSESLVYKWCQDKESESGSGVENPLDRIAKVVKITDDRDPIRWLCQTVDGFLVENPVARIQQSAPILDATQKLLSEFSELLGAVSASFNNDQNIDSTEAERIREEWEQLKTLAEQFVVACETGVYTQRKQH